jgi:hypothetical protein
MDTPSTRDTDPSGPGCGCLRERRDDTHTAQLNVSFEGCQTGAHTVWAPTHKLGMHQMAVYGLTVEASGAEDAYWVPPWRIKRVTLMGTADPARVRAAQDARDEDCPRC